MGEPIEFDEDGLVDALGAAQQLGFLGSRPIPEAIEHARAVVAGLDEVRGAVVDLGAGGGLPGLVIVRDRPDLSVTMIDRRTKRTDFLERMVRRYGLTDRVEVLGWDVETLIASCVGGDRMCFDAAVARGFGPPDRTLSYMAQLVRPGGRLVVTEPPDGDRWDPSWLAAAGVVRVPAGSSIAVFRRRDE